MFYEYFHEESNKQMHQNNIISIKKWKLLSYDL